MCATIQIITEDSNLVRDQDGEDNLWKEKWNILLGREDGETREGTGIRKVEKGMWGGTTNTKGHLEQNIYIYGILLL